VRSDILIALVLLLAFAAVVYFSTSSPLH